METINFKGIKYQVLPEDPINACRGCDLNWACNNVDMDCGSRNVIFRKLEEMPEGIIRTTVYNVNGVTESFDNLEDAVKAKKRIDAVTYFNRHACDFAPDLSANELIDLIKEHKDMIQKVIDEVT